MAYRCTSKVPFALVAGVLVSGCAGDQAPTLSLPSMPTVGAISHPPTSDPLSTPPGAVPSAAIVIDQSGGAGGSATDIYSRLASGAMKCWFAVGGPLKKDYVYHAAADPASRGGKAKITIHQRDPTQPNPRGLKSYTIDILPSGESSATVKAENLKMPDAFATAMTSDVARWTKGESDCAQASAVAGWIPGSHEADASESHAAKTKAKKGKTKAKSKSAHAKAARPALKASAGN